MWVMHDGFFWGMHWIWWILWVLLIFWIIFTPYRWGRTQSSDSAMDILRERYARGEIDKTEFDARKKDLQKT